MDFYLGFFDNSNRGNLVLVMAFPAANDLAGKIAGDRIRLTAVPASELSHTDLQGNRIPWES